MQHYENEGGSSADSTQPIPRNLADKPSLADLFQEMFPDLHRAAQGVMSGQHGSHTLQATALVNECYMRLQKAGREEWSDRTHFLQSAAKVMRTVLIDHYRAKSAGKRAGNRRDVELDLIVSEIEEQGVDLEILERALARLEKEQPDMAQMVQLKYFCGIEMRTIAETLGMPLRTLERRWETTKKWLFIQMQ